MVAATAGRLRRGTRVLGQLIRNTRLVSSIRRSRPVKSRAAFIAANGLPRGGGEAKRWTLVDGREVWLRPGSRDLDIFEEIFVSGIYDPPPEVLAALPRDRPPVIADLGANVGLFGVRMLQLFPGAEVRSFEPDPDNLALLRRVHGSGGHDDRWSVYPVAVGTEPGTLRFLAGLLSESRAAGPEHEDGVIEVQVIDVFDHLADADLVKMDIEGGEWPILRDERFADIPAAALVLEFHGFRSWTHDIRAEVSDRLGAAGFTVRHTEWHPMGLGQAWAWREAVSAPPRPRA